MLTPFFDYIAQFDPTFRHRVQGVSVQDTGRLAELYGRPLPASYRELLLTMGANPGGAHFAGYARTEFDIVYELTAELIQDDMYQDLLRSCIVIGQGVFPGATLCLEEIGGDEPRVVTADVEVLSPIAGSLLHLLMQHAFTVHALRALPHQRVWGGRELSDRSLAPQVLRGLGFEPCWFADEYAWCGERDDARVVISQIKGEPVGVRLSAADEATLDEIARALEPALGVRTDKVGVQRPPSWAYGATAV